MKRLAILLAGTAMAAMLTASLPATAAAPAPGAVVDDAVVGAWTLYASRFVTPDGRVVDDANNGISHSEGQGYGLLMAVAADDRPSFERILAWTRRELMVRGDGLAAWRWDPAAEPHVTDRNNATDGDILIAWALDRAAKRWNVPAYADEARAIVEAVLAKTVTPSPLGDLLLPGVDGFRAGEQPDGPIVNLSYWVFPALEELGETVPALAEAGVAENGRRLATEARFGQSGLPVDWTSLAGERPEPARNFPPEFGYNAVRVPLYLAWSRTPDPELLGPMADALSPANGGMRVVDVATGQTVTALADPGYRAVVDVADCALGRTAKSRAAETFEPTHYYPSTLHVLSLMALAERYPQCLR